jgi:hypothetical protein
MWSTGAWGADLSPSSVTYRETTDAQTIPFTWELKRRGDDIHIEVTREKERFFNRFEPSGATIRWRHLAPARDITAHREGDRIVLKGLIEGKEIEKAWTIDDAPWYQALSFCLCTFLESDERKIEFWMIRPDTVNAIKMQAEKVAQEPVAVDGRKFQTMHIKVRRAGFLSLFWHGDYWYRLEDGLFLKYKGVHGSPGTPATVVEVDF